jgi:hypothetical protein
VIRYRYQIVWAALYALAGAMGAAPPALAQQGDVINTRSGDPNADGCIEGWPHPQYGSPDRWDVNDPTWKELANDAYYALCVGSCTGQSAYCYKNPYFGGDSYETTYDPLRDGDPPLVMEDGTPVDVAFGDVPNVGPGHPASDSQGSECANGEEPPQCFAQAPPPREPFDLGAKVFEPGPTFDFPATDPRGQKVAVKLTIEDGGEPPKEDNVDWDKWYHDWIQLIVEKAHLPIKQQFTGDPNSYKTVVHYTVSSDGRWKFEVDDVRSAYGVAVYARLSRIQAIRFPAGSKLTRIDRTFTFIRNMPGGDLRSGPPKEP